MAERSERGSPTSSPVKSGRATTRAERDAAKAAADLPPVDVDELLASVRKRLDSATSGDGEASNGVSEVDASSGADVRLPEEPLARSLELLKQLGPLDPRAPIHSHRPLIGPLVAIFKRLGRFGFAPIFSSAFEHQAAIDRALLSYADEVFRRLVGMESDLRTRLERVEARQAMELETLRRRLAWLEERVSAGEPKPAASGSRDGG